MLRANTRSHPLAPCPPSAECFPSEGTRGQNVLASRYRMPSSEEFPARVTCSRQSGPSRRDQGDEHDPAGFSAGQWNRAGTGGMRWPEEKERLLRMLTQLLVSSLISCSCPPLTPRPPHTHTPPPTSLPLIQGHRTVNIYSVVAQTGEQSRSPR